MIAVTLGGPRWKACRETFPEVAPFSGTPARAVDPDSKREAIANTFHRLAVWAVRRRLDDLVIQDDVRFRGEIPDGYGVFGRYRGRDHWCPQAFRFDRQTWLQAVEVWDGQTQVCKAWEPLIAELPRFDLASDHLEEPALVGRNAGCRGCGRT